MKFSQKVLLDDQLVIVMVHNVEDREEAKAILKKAQPLSALDVQEFNGINFLHLNAGLGFDGDINFTKEASKAGLSGTIVAGWATI